jgi:hypothetical protein
MPFGTATVVTNNGKRTAADRLQTTPTRNAFKFSEIGTGATGAARTAVAADTALTTASGSRVSGTESTITTTQTGDTYQVVAAHSIGGTVAIDEAGLFDASSAGNMGVSATFAVLNLVNGDTLTLTWKTQAT